MDRQQECATLGPMLISRARLQPLSRGHREIEHGHVWTNLASEPNRFVTVGRLSEDEELFLLEQRPEALSYDVMIIGEKNTQHVGRELLPVDKCVPCC